LPSSPPRRSSDLPSTPASTGPTPLISGTKSRFRCGPYSASTAMTKRTDFPAIGARLAILILYAFASADRHHGSCHGGDELGLAFGAVGIGLTVGDDDRGAGLCYGPAGQKGIFATRGPEDYLELDGKHTGIVGDQREGRISARGVQRR